MNILMLPTLHESRLLHKKKFCSLGNFSGSGSWRMFCNGLDTMYMYKNLMCVVCVLDYYQMNSQLVGLYFGKLGT